MIPEQGVLEEYQALRAEILATWDRRNSRLSISWAAISVLLTASVLSKAPELGCITLLMVCAGWQDELRWYDKMVRIGSYIRIIIEPQIPGLQWETAIFLLDFSKEKTGNRKQFFSTIFTTYGIFTMSSIVISFALFAECSPLPPTRNILFFALCLLGITFSIRVLSEAMNFPNRYATWNEKFSAISEQLKACKE